MICRLERKNTVRIFFTKPRNEQTRIFQLTKIPTKYTLCDKEVLIDWIKTTYLDK